MTGEEYMEKNRRCTDVLFTLIFLAFWVGMVYAGAYGFSKGDPRILVYGTDYQGNLCGKGALEDFKVRYFVNPYEVLEAGNTAGANIKDAKSICLKACPAASSTLSWVCNYPDSLDSRGLNAITSTTTSYDQWAAMNYDYYSSITTGSHQANSRVYKGPCYPVLLPTTESYGTCSYYAKQTSGAKTAFASLLSTNSQSTPESYDLDDKVTALSDAVAEMLSTPASVMERYIEDFAKAWVVCLVCGFFAPVVLSFVWLGIMRYLAGFFAYFVIAFVNIFAILCTLWLYMKAGVIGNDAIAASDEDGGSSYTDPSEDNQEVLTYAAYACTALTVILLLFTLLMLKRVRIAVAVIKVATQCIAAAPMTIVFPLIPVFVALALFAYWVAAAVYMYSAGDIEQQSCTLTAGAQPQRYCADSADAKNCHCGYETKMTKDLQYMLLYHLFGLLWTTQWLQALTYLTIAYVFALFYFRGGSFSEGMRGCCSSPVFQARYIHWSPYDPVGVVNADP
jgi:choline transporter-like protein 2/4/5